MEDVTTAYQREEAIRARDPDGLISRGQYLAASKILRGQGLDRFVLCDRPGKLPGLRWRLEVQGVFFAALGRKLEVFGFTARDVVLQALACRPTTTKVE